MGLAVAGVAAVAAVLVANAPPPLRANPMVGLVRWHATGTDVVVLGGVGGRSALGPRPVLESLRRSGVDAIDLLVVADGAVPRGTLGALADAHAVGQVIAHAPAAPDLGVAPAPGQEAIVAVGGLVVRLVPTADRLVVDARPAG